MIVRAEAAVPQPSWTRDAQPPQVLEENWLFRLSRDRFRSRRTSKSHDYYVMHLADAVNVVALTPDRRVILVEQFRAGSANDSWETPGGLVNPGEDPLAAGARELLEETGFAGDPPTLLGLAWANPSILSSRISTILITNANAVGPSRPDEHEELRVNAVPATRIPKMIASGEISHALAAHSLMTWMVSELPGGPMRLPSQGGLSPAQVRISSMMVAVAVVAMICAIVANLGPRATVVLLTASALPLASVIVHLWLDSPERCVLLRGWRMSPRRRLMRGFTMISLTGLILIGSYLLLHFLSQFR
jgi:8-oxo-dGTP pyrophosphatase MutT (NUDIX family)